MSGKHENEEYVLWLDYKNNRDKSRIAVRETSVSRHNGGPIMDLP